MNHNPHHNKKPSEMPLKQWLFERASELGENPDSFTTKFYAGNFIAQLPLRRISAHNTVIRSDARLPQAMIDVYPRPGEITLKEWCVRMADQLGITPHAVWNRVNRQRLQPMPKLRRVNKRVIYVDTASGPRS